MNSTYWFELAKAEEYNFIAVSRYMANGLKCLIEEMKAGNNE